MSNFWEVKCRQGAWRGKIYILAPSEWEAGKQTEIALNQLDIHAEVVEVNSFLELDSIQIQDDPVSSENLCLLCNQPIDGGPISKRTVLSVKTDIPFLGRVRVFGEVRTRTCPGCGKREEWQINFGYIPEIWFREESRILPFVGHCLKEVGR